MDIIKTDGVDIKSWCPTVEEGAMDQMKLIAKLPYVKECCLMADGHLGMDCCIGGVVACENVVVPNFVGSDCGCGMAAMRTNLTIDDMTEDKKQRLFDLISQAVPVGFSHNTDERRKDLAKRYQDKIDFLIDKSNIASFADHNPIGDCDKSILSQMGTLGGGNHFIECQVDEEGFVWIMLHSGSRNIGKKLGDYFNDIAKDLNAKWFSVASAIPFLPTDTAEGKAYLAWMEFALRFAFLNRQVMMHSILAVFEREFCNVKFTTSSLVDDTVNGMITIHHNFAAIENHHGRNYWIHRKGATKADVNRTGIIPGSMGTSSYITKGLGNHNSLLSASHGAGRKMGRMEFSRQMKDNQDQIDKSLEGIIHSDFGEFQHGKMKGVKDVSEAPAAYKDIDLIMSWQNDLVEPIVKLRPLISIKG